MDEKDIKKHIDQYLKSQTVISIATFGEKPWPAIVYYVSDDELNLYYTSSRNSEHSKNIEINSEVAATIVNSNQKLSDSKIGLQIYGVVEVVNTLSKIKWAVKLWNKLIADNPDDHVSYEKFIEASKSRVYKIKPIKIKFFNEELFEDKPFRTVEFN